jgi:hypothetical protein
VAYLYRCVDKEDKTISAQRTRDIAAAKRFLAQAMTKRGVPQKITLDGYTASHEAVAELQAEKRLPNDLVVLTNRYVNNIFEQDHRRVKQKVRPMLGFKRFAHATITITGSELAQQIQKGNLYLINLLPSSTRFAGLECSAGCLSSTSSRCSLIFICELHRNLPMYGYPAQGLVLSFRDAGHPSSVLPWPNSRSSNGRCSGRTKIHT